MRLGDEGDRDGDDIEDELEEDDQQLLLFSDP